MEERSELIITCENNKGFWYSLFSLCNGLRPGNPTRNPARSESVKTITIERLDQLEPGMKNKGNCVFKGWAGCWANVEVTDWFGQVFPGWYETESVVMSFLNQEVEVPE